VGAVFVVMAYRILAPFVSLIVWGGVIAIALYPLYLRLVGRLGGRRKLVATLFVLIAIGVIVVPTVAVSTSLFESAQHLGEGLENGTLKVPPPPPKVKDWPVVGDKANEIWVMASRNLQGLAVKYGPQLKAVAGSVLSAGASAGAGVLQFILAVLVASMFLVNGESSYRGLHALSSRVFGRERGEAFVDMSAKTVRSVATGVLGVAFIQALLAGVGMGVAGVPFAGIWTVLVLLMAIMQLPPLIIMLPIALWVLGSADSQLIAWGFMVWAILVSGSDAVLKPLLLGRGVDVPMVVVLLGAIGGMILHGIIGLFAGAVVLAVVYRLMMEWMTSGSVDPTAEAAAESVEA